MKNRKNYLNNKNLIGEIEHYGYVYSVKKLVLTYVLMLASGIIAAYLFRLHLAGYISISVYLLLITPKLIAQAYKTMYEQRRFSDASKYIEKMLYYFKAHNKIITALSDASLIFPEGEMKDTILQAVDYIYNQDDSIFDKETREYFKNDFTATSTRTVEEKALKIIELKFPNKRIKRMHSFFIKVEENGGNPDLGIELMLNDRNDWVSSIVNEQKDKAYARKIFIGLSVAILLVALVILYLPIKNKSLNFDISQSSAVRVVSTVVIIFTINLYSKINKAIEKSWFNDENSKYATSEYYYKVVNYDFKKEKRKALTYTAITLAITILLYVISYSNVILILGLLIAVFMYFSSSLGYKVGKAQVSRAVQTEFADWIMEVALRIQFSNVVAAIADSYDTAPDILKPEIEKLLTELGETPTSPEPYNNFCKFFNFEDIGIVMNTLYSVMSASGSDVDKELSTIFSQNRKQANTVSEQQRKNKDARNKLYCYWEILACCVLLLTDMAFYALYFIDGITSII